MKYQKAVNKEGLISMRASWLIAVIFVLSVGLLPAQQRQELAPAQPRYAVIVSVGDTAVTTELHGSDADACALYHTLTGVGGFTANHVKLFSTPQSCKQVESKQPGDNGLRQELRELNNQMERNALLFFAFSGHGVSYQGKSFLRLPGSTLALSGAPQNALELSELLNLLSPDRAKPRQLLLALDACRDSGGSAMSDPQKKVLSEQVDRTIDQFASAHPNVSGAVLFSSQAGEMSYSRFTNPVGYFTWALVKGLLGGAADQDGAVHLGDLTNYVEREVPDLVKYDLLRIVMAKHLAQQPHSRRIGSKGDAIEVSVTKPQQSFYYNCEIFLTTTVRGQLHDRRALDCASPTSGLNELLPFLNSDDSRFKIVSALEIIKEPYGDRPPDSDVDFLVRFTFHVNQTHVSYILCPQHAERNGIEVRRGESELVIDALHAFAGWGHIMGDIGADPDVIHPGYTTDTMCEIPN
jgi:Caspase domain